MHYHYSEINMAADLFLLQEEVALANRLAEKNDRPLLTIAWNRGASQKVVVDEVPYELPAGGVILLIVDHVAEFSKPKDIITWRFNREFYCIIDHDAEVGCAGFLFYGMPSPMLLELDQDHFRKLDLLHQVFVDEFATHDNIQGEMLRMLLKRLIIILTRLAREQHLKIAPAREELATIRRFNLLVEKHYTKLHQVQDYADLLHKSPKTLSNLFRKYSDTTPLKVIRERIALEAKRLLRYTDKPVGEIGYDLGFPESAHFSRFFKGVVGQSPNLFREVS